MRKKIPSFCNLALVVEARNQSEIFSKQYTIYFMEFFFTKPILRLNQYFINLALGSIISFNTKRIIWEILIFFRKLKWKTLQNHLKRDKNYFDNFYTEKKDIASTNVEIGSMPYLWVLTLIPIYFNFSYKFLNPDCFLQFEF